MVVIRPVAMSDVDALFALAHETSFGLTTLPRDRDLLAQRVEESRHGFDTISRKPRGESYLFVMEDTEARRVVGTSGVVSKVGGFEPFYAYRIETQVLESKMLGISTQHRTLHLVTDHDGPCEIGSLFLTPDYRKGGLGRLLSICRFLFMADHRHHFDDEVIAEMRGVISDQGQSPFWDAVGKHFFAMDFPKADYLSIVNKEFIGDLMPKHPLYIRLLPQSAQDVIGQVHEQTRPARRMLESEGFAFRNLVDIFEAGPMLHCARDQIRSVRESTLASVNEISDAIIEPADQVISNARRDFRACLAGVSRLDDGAVRIGRDVASALNVNVGDKVRYVAMRPPTGTPEAAR